MKTQTSHIEISVGFVPDIFSTLPRIPTHTFLHCLNALYVNTQLLAGNVISLHLHLVGQNDCPDETTMPLSRFQLDLAGQTGALQRHIAMLRGAPVPPQEWICYAVLWRIAEIDDVTTTLTLLLNAADLLMELYESILPMAVQQCDHAVSYYLLAGHLAALNEHSRELEHSIRQPVSLSA